MKIKISNLSLAFYGLVQELVIPDLFRDLKILFADGIIVLNSAAMNRLTTFRTAPYVSLCRINDKPAVSNVLRKEYL